MKIYFLAAAQSVARVQVKLQERSNLTKFTDCTFAGDFNKFVNFYCGQLTGTYGDGVRILPTDSRDVVIEEIRIYEHPGKFYFIVFQFGQELNDVFRSRLRLSRRRRRRILPAPCGILSDRKPSALRL